MLCLNRKHWVIGGPVNNGGMVLRWIRDELASSEVETAKRLGIDPYDVLTKIAERVRPVQTDYYSIHTSQGNVHHYGIQMYVAPSSV